MALPFVSVLVPVRNEAPFIERCLYSLAAQDYPRAAFEVIVIDGGSTDTTAGAVRRFAAESTLDVRLLDNPHEKTAAGLNIGLRAACGGVIIRVDGHAAAAPDFISNSVRALDFTGADCVGGVIESEGVSPLGQAIALAMSSRFGVGGAAFRVGGEGPADTVAFGAYRRDVFDRIGAFTEDIDRGEDDEFNYRLLDAGGRIELVPAIRARYTVRDSLGGLFRQYFGYGRAKPLVLARHPAQARPRQFAPAAFVLGAAGASLLALLGWRRPLRSLARSYALSTGAASLLAAAQHGWRHLPRLPLAFVTLHVAYGLGFIAGAAALLGRRPGRGPGRRRGR